MEILSDNHKNKPRSCCSNVVITLTASCSIVNFVRVCAEPVWSDIIWPSSLIASLMSRTRNLQHVVLSYNEMQFIHSFISGMHHYECVAPNIDINLRSGRFWAKSTASFRKRLNVSRSCWIVLRNAAYKSKTKCRRLQFLLDSIHGFETCGQLDTIRGSQQLI